MFSAKRISEFQPVIREKTEKFCQKLSEYQDDGRVLPLHRALMALSTDIITEYAFARAYNQLDSPNFQDTLHEALLAIYTTGQFALHFPIVFPILDLLPDWFVLRAQPVLQPVLGLRKVRHPFDLRNHVPNILKRTLDGKLANFAITSIKGTRPSHILQSFGNF